MSEEIFRLLVKKLSEELTENEDQKVKELLQKSEYRKEYDELKNIWNSLKINTPQKKSWKKINKKINYNPTFNFINLLAYAALLAIFITSGYFIFNFQKTFLIQNTQSTNLTVILPDKSTIILYPGSKIKYKKTLTGKFNREVWFSERGYFEITKNPTKRFIVHTKNLDVTVYGTKFNIFENKEQTEITLVEGSVKISNLKGIQDTSFFMKPGDVVNFKINQKKILKYKSNVKIATYWLKKRIIFDNYSLNDIKLIFKDYYNKILILDNKKTIQYRISGTAPSDDFYAIVQALTKITKTTAYFRKDTIILK